MELNDTRKQIISLIAKGKEKEQRLKVKDIEIALKLNRAGIVRHLKESEESKWIKRIPKGKETYLEITLEGLKVLGYYDFNELLDKSGVLQDYTCSAVLKQLLVYKTHRDTMKEYDACIHNLLKNRLLKESDNHELEVSYIAFSILSDNEVFKNEIVTHFGNFFNQNITEVISGLEKKVGKKINVPYMMYSDNIIELILNALKESQKITVEVLYPQNKTINHIIEDDATFNSVEEVIRDHVKAKMLDFLMSTVGSELLKTIYPSLKIEF